MSGPKKWVSSKVHRKASSKSSLGSNNSGSSLLDERTHHRAPPSPPTRLPLEDTTTATAIVGFGSGSTLMTSDGAPGGHSTICSNSSIDSFGTGFTHSPLTHSPSTTPPKKTWEKNYKTFLRKTGIHSKAPALSTRAPTQQHEVPIKPLPRVHHHSHKSHKSLSENATTLLSKSHHHLPLFFTHNDHHGASLEDLGPDLADGFEVHSQNKASSVWSAPLPPLSPSKHKESGTRGGSIFKRLRSKTKSSDNLDATMRKGVDRKSPTNTPPGSVASTPIHTSSPLVSSSVTTLQEGLEKAAMLSEALSPPSLTSSSSLGSHKQRLDPALSQSISPQGELNDNQMDQARHRGYSVTMAPSTMLSQTPTTLPALFSRVQSMGSSPIIPEGEPAIMHEDELIREKRKAFTDFHNMGIDSSSAYLGDESSLHKQSVFLSSMAYPAGSAGGKVHSQHHSQHTLSRSGASSLDQKRTNISPSTSLSSVSETTTQHKESGADFSPERALQSLKGPEQWTKGEKHAIVPGVLSMCPIQVLNNIMSKEEESSSRPSLKSRGSQGGFGIGSIISEDENVDSNGWFFADHHQPTPAGGMLPCHGGSVSSSTASGFGKILLGKATVAPLGMRSFLNEVYGWCTGVFILRQNYLFEYREGDSLNGLPWGYVHLPLAEVYPHKHFTNALHLEFFEKPCSKSGKRSLLLRVESKGERDRWVSLLQSAARMTIHDLYDVDESEGAPEFGNGRYVVVRPAKRRDRRMAMSFSDTRYPHTANSQESFRNISSYDSLGGGKSSNPDLEGAVVEYNCALKIIDKTEFWSLVRKGRERADTLVREAAIQTTLAVQGVDAPGFLRLRNIFETGEKLVLELEMLKGINLFQHVSSRGVLDEVEAAHIMRDLLNCLNVLDQVGIAHRDIKPANLLMCHSENNDGTKIKLADYGMASFVGVDNLVRGRCGTPGFVAPEILLTGVNGGYGNKVDMFSAGVTLYVMLAGYEPFYGESDAELIDANREARVDFPHADWHTVSIEGRDLIERLLVVDPMKRIGPSEALRHPWITRRATALQSEV
mmetsp:Transcript_8369/g.18751  ORF Transcript_8369/g.18751 Transcript_8369/m.18751 type:complete len:1053 (+) Transcript_8369:429-3587(+)|eukprot:CAMPEP_0172317764 /NCGR_PEP_ID=MMETSP1058-20130122/32659_1 /TAXON_ID=83371 /ORGANISM="Detonula confervacea, Strain CCMP 353" /LENGTH=1052 /DNA_ID=CAMNT_0013032395 /DNA_START=418 /DNA_END=3576 /DNA_ORIENTATION=+